MEFIGIPLVKPSNRKHGACVMTIGALIMLCLYAVGKNLVGFDIALPLIFGVSTVLMSLTYGINVKNFGWRGPVIVTLFVSIALCLSALPFAFY